MASTAISTVLAKLIPLNRDDDVVSVLTLANDLASGSDASGNVLSATLARLVSINSSSLYKRVAERLSEFEHVYGALDKPANG